MRGSAVCARRALQPVRLAEHTPHRANSCEGIGLPPEPPPVPGKRAPCSLRVEFQLHAAFITCTIPLAHDMCPDLAGGTVFGNFFKEVTMRIEKEAKPRCEFIDLQPARKHPVDVLDAVAKREGQLLHSGRSGFANVITADGDGMEARHMPSCKLNGVGD